MREKARNLASNWTWGHTAVVLAVLSWLIGTFGPVTEPDLYWHLLIGHSILADGNLSGDPATTFGPHSDWVTTQAGAEALGYLWFKVFGWGGFVFLRILGAFAVGSAVAWATFTLTPRTMKQGVRCWIAATATFVLAQQVPIQERSQVLTFILLPLLAVALVRLVYTGRVPNPFVVFVVTMCWAWVHGGALLVAPVLFAGTILRLAARRTGFLGASGHDEGFFLRGLVVSSAAFLATLATPIGWLVYQQAGAVSASASVAIVEWQRPFPDFPFVYLLAPVMLLLWGIAVLLLGRRSFSRRLFIVDAALLLPLAVYAETANRAASVALLLATPLAARRLTQAIVLQWRSPIRPILHGAALPLAAVATLGAAGLTVFGVVTAAPVGPDSPQRILSGLAATSGERNVIGTYNATGRLQLLTQSQVRTGIDGRADRYSPDQIRRYLQLRAAYPGWETTLESDYAGATDYIDYSEANIVPELKKLGWREVCREQPAEGKEWVWLTAPNVTGACPAVTGALSANVDR